ncbi:MAG: DUF4911 domain-containing protein [bacterium]
MKSDELTLHVKVNPKEICFLSNVIESYEVFGIVRTINPKSGLIEILISPDFIEEIHNLLDDLKQSMDIQYVHPQN